ncbi:MAG TPA: hypothetical protein EYQ61_08050 [Dehalococcoidia bacterium]|jgi:hypothetical protein|nr:hypothetical protein [Dehalococcoidia bacterium]
MSIRKYLHFTILVAILGTALTMVAVTGCGSGDSGWSDDTSFVATDEDSIQILQPNGVFTADDVEAAGWKNSKELSPETLPDATSVWYGFYQQRDVEVRVYESQATAIASGQEIADVATGRRKPAPFASGGISSTRTSYSAYAIVGNLILLCEIKIEDCQGLINGIE